MNTTKMLVAKGFDDLAKIEDKMNKIRSSEIHYKDLSSEDKEFVNVYNEKYRLKIDNILFD